MGGRRFVEGLYQALFSFRLACRNVIYKAKDCGAFFKVRGPVTTSFEVGWEGRVGGRARGKFGCSVFLAVYRTVRLLNLSWVIVERSPVSKFQAAEKYLSPTEPNCTCRIHSTSLQIL